MQVMPDRLDLTYCTNIHAGESWSEVLESLHRYAIPLKQSLSPDKPFGLGLRLSAVAARELRSGDRLQQFREFLEQNGMYVSIINGFPYGSFHGVEVKENVFAPDWRDPARVEYTLNLVEILAILLNEDTDGGISTLPLSYKPWLAQASEAVWPSVIHNLIQVVARLVQIHAETGKTIHLDIEPEPNGLIETTEEFIDFFEGPLRHFGEPMLAEALGISLSVAREHLYQHVQICFDVCHMAVEFESPLRSLDLLAQHGIRVGRAQISSALRVPLDGPPEERQRRLDDLRKYVEPVYLHQVIERKADAGPVRYTDLDKALAAAQDKLPREWRIHFHVPIFADGFGSLLSTQVENQQVIAAIAANEYTHHLEVETYTWSVLPEELRIDLGASIERELRWVLDQL